MNSKSAEVIVKDTGPVLERRLFELRFAEMKTERQTWFETWREISDFIVPTRGFFYEQPNSGKKIDHKRILDSKGAKAVRVLGAGMTSGLTSPSSPWFKLSITDQELLRFKPVKVWLAHVQDVMMSIFERSNIYGAFNSMYEELGSFGTASCALMSDYKTVIRAKTFTAGDYFLGCGPDGRVDTFAREYSFTVHQLVKEFGIENCSQTVKNLYLNGSVDKWIPVIYFLEQNDDRIPDKADFKNMLYRAVYWEVGSPTDTYLRISGFNEFPILCPRWGITKTTDIYGKGPGWDALGDVKMLQKLQRDKLIALDKMINPPVQIDGTFEGQVNTLPGGINRASATAPNAGMRSAYQIAPDFDHIELMIEKTKAAIDETFYVDLFRMLSTIDRTANQQKTALEISTRYEEKLLQLGPVITSMESELYDPCISRTFNLMLEVGLVPPAPPELQGHELEVEYTSILGQAQKMAGTGAIEQTTSFVTGLAQVFPSIVDCFDSDELAAEYGELKNIPPKIMRDAKEIAAIRQQRNQAEQQAQQAQKTQQMVEGAKTLSETKLGQGSALDKVVEGIRQNQPIRAAQ